MPLPFKVKARPVVTLSSVVGIEGQVFARPWSLQEFEAISPEIEELKVDPAGIKRIREILADRLTDEVGNPGVVSAEDLESLPTPTVADLFRQICRRCGFASASDAEKN
jgi:hypothetical protein